MTARITINLSEDGPLEIRPNEEGRDVLVRELLRLDDRDDHFHLGPKNMSGVDLSNRPYCPTDKVLEWGKVMLRSDAADQQYFPHVFEQT